MCEYLHLEQRVVFAYLTCGGKYKEQSKPQVTEEIVTALSSINSSTDQYVYHILIAAYVQNKNILDSTLSTLFLSMFVEIYPQGDSIYSEIFQVCPGGLWVAILLRSEGILHPSRPGDFEESHVGHSSPRVSCRHTTSVISLLIPCC